MRILLFTGKGGVGKSTIAAGTAALAAAGGHRTLVLSTDAAHSLADAYGVPVGAEPTQVADRLFVQQVDAQLRFQQSWAEIQGYLLSVLDVAGVDPVAAEELTVIPGAEEVLALLELRLHALSGAWDVVVVDCAPTAETLRLLALPEALGWYMQRVFPAERRIVKALRPVLTRAAGVPMPADDVFDAVERLHAELDEVRQLLSGPGSSVRIVLTPESVVLAEARRSHTTLSLYGYRVDGVVANRVFPAEDADDWRAGWVLAQDEVLAQVEQSFGDLPVWRSVYRPREPIGVEALTALAREVYAGTDPLAPPAGDGPFRVQRTATGAVLHLALPGVSRDDVDLARNGEELVVTVGSYRRLLTLPAGLARFQVAGARVMDGELQVRFRETPAATGPTTETTTDTTDTTDTAGTAGTAERRHG
ncbi:ArsA family ATPase [Nocardioides dongkuii]|uniref:ArsA family ATPase n=1 Tax=Nocardioides dongkuii TaxID=2760089 RepID=UPI00187803A4|nr:ArsA family ATPase [Nocardioides dongkuii]